MSFGFFQKHRTIQKFLLSSSYGRGPGEKRENHAFGMIRALMEMMETGCNKLHKRIESVCSFICAGGKKMQIDLENS